MEGFTLADRLRDVADTAAADIRECANLCDTYYSKKLLVKVLKAPAWEAKLAEFLDRFAQRRSDFEFALSIHSTKTVEATKNAVHDIGNKCAIPIPTLYCADAIFMFRSRVDDLRNMFHYLFIEDRPPDEQSIATKIDMNGGVGCVQHNDAILQKLMYYEDSLLSANSKSWDADSVSNSNQHVKVQTDMAERTAQEPYLATLKSDLREDVNAAAEKNMTQFATRFDLRVSRLFGDLREENDHVIRKLDAEPHERIVNEVCLLKIIAFAEFHTLSLRN